MAACNDCPERRASAVECESVARGLLALLHGNNLDEHSATLATTVLLEYGQRCERHATPRLLDVARETHKRLGEDTAARVACNRPTAGDELACAQTLSSIGAPCLEGALYGALSPAGKIWFHTSLRLRRAFSAVERPWGVAELARNSMRAVNAERRPRDTDGAGRA